MVQAHLVQVVIARPIDRLFTYQIPEALLGQIQCGDLLLVPFGKKSLLACVIELQTSHDLDQSTSVKLIQLHLPHLPQFPKALIQLMKQMAHYYHCSLGEVFKMMMPHVSVQKRMVWNHQELKSTPPSQAVKVLSEVIAYHPFTYDDLPIAISKKERQIWLANHWCQAHQIPDTPKKSFLLSVKRPALVSKSKKLSIACHIYIEHQQKVTFEQVVQHFHDRKKTSIKKALKELFDADLLELVLQSNDHHTVITNHLIVDVSDEETEEKSSQLIPSSSSSSSNPSSSSTSLIEPTKKLHGAYVQLNHEQRMVFEQMKNQNGYQCYLLYGITGSGKTEVYLSMIEHVLAQKKHVLVLLPEIGLTPQTMRRFKARLNVPILPWHSKLSPQDKFKIWSTLQQTEPCVLMGARSALFTPLSPLGLIVVDESHDTSYKQGDGIRYHARDMAVSRAYLENCPIILGSATPSLESVYNVRQNKYQLMRLTQRAQGAQLPHVEIIDLKRNNVIHHQAPAFSHPLLNAIRIRIERGEQSILFLNRRGFSQSVRCISCGFIFKCPDCEITMPWHKHSQKLSCHHCDFKAVLPHQCPSCGQMDSYAPIGKGTERLEEQLQSVFPKVNIMRLDRDAQLHPLEFETQMRSGAIDILIGTQMVTKGHDFPKVTLVGVIDADAALDLPDFRASERTYQLLSQVAGRAGRAELPGTVMIQTYRPREPLLQAALKHDFDAFCQHELTLRNLIAYPPFQYTAIIRIESARFDLLQKLMQSLQDYRSLSSNTRVRGPNPAPIQQVRGRRRWMILFLSPTRHILHQEIRNIRQTYNLYSDSNIKVNIDIDPIDFL